MEVRTRSLRSLRSLRCEAANSESRIATREFSGAEGVKLNLPSTSTIESTELSEYDRTDPAVWVHLNF